MAPDDDEITVPLMFGDSPRWLIAHVDVGDDAALRMIVNPGYPISAVTERALHDLLVRGLAAPEAGGTYLVKQLQVEGQALPDTHVRVRDAMHRFGVDGILGFDFATNFTDLCLHIPTLRLTLRP